MVLGGVHDGQLPAVAGIELVREDLVHHLDHGVVVGNQEPRLAVGRKIHVALAKRLAEGAAHRLLAEMLHIEGRLALTLRHQHARVEGAQQHHVPETRQQFLIGRKPAQGPTASPSRLSTRMIE